MADHCASSAVSTPKAPPSCSFSRLKELGPIHTGQKCQMEQENSGISKFPEKGQPREVNEIFGTNFRKISVPFDFEPEFLEILVEWNAPVLFVFFSCYGRPTLPLLRKATNQGHKKNSN